MGMGSMLPASDILSPVNPRQLNYFLRIAELRSFTKAAAILHIAQPALSRQIQQLEDDLGVRLFVRSDAGVSLTEAGDVLRTRASSLLRHFANVRDEVGALSDCVHGRLQFGMPPSLFDLATMPVLLAMRERYPSVQPSVIEGISSSIYELVQVGRLDFGVVVSTESMLGLHHLDLISEQLFLARPAGPGLTDPGPVTLAEVAAQPLVLTQSTNTLRAVLDDAMRRQGLSFNTLLEANSTRVLTALVAAGVGCSVLTYSALANDVAAGRLTAAPIEGLAVTWRLVHSRERALSLAARILVVLLLEVTAQATAAGRWPGVTLLQPSGMGSIPI
jgi:LysR family nitrogen assimilation transcriptional regulator